jgi:ABC-type transporter Mla MlaB component
VITLALRGPIHRHGIAPLCASVDRWLESTGASVLECEVGAVCTDAVTVEALARLRLTVGRRGASLRLRGVTSDLRELIALAGLDQVLVG